MSVNQMQAEYDLCNLLQTLKLNNEPFKGNTDVVVRNTADAMVEDQNYLSDGMSESSSSSSNSVEAMFEGCAYLQGIQSRLENYTTTGGEYLDAIFTHREIVLAYPEGHQKCSKGFSDLAYQLEQRAWRADRDADTEAVIAFRNEAWMIANTIWPMTQLRPTHAKSHFACIMPMM